MFTKKSECIDGYELHAFYDGEEHSEPIILLHGIGVSHAYFEPLMKEMARHYWVIALDLPGYGKTDDPEITPSIDELARLVNQFVRAKRITVSSIIGHSMGAQIAIQAIIEDSSLYNKCILMAPTINKYERSLWMQGIRLFQDTLKEPLKVNMIIFRDYLRMGILRYMKTTSSMLNATIEEDVRQVKIPLLIVNGTRDPICPDEWAQHLAEIAPDGKLKNINGAAHVFQYSYAKETAAVCDVFIKE